jgi:hypothetical protein
MKTFYPVPEKGTRGDKLIFNFQGQIVTAPNSAPEDRWQCNYFLLLLKNDVFWFNSRYKCNTHNNHN